MKKCLCILNILAIILYVTSLADATMMSTNVNVSSGIFLDGFPPLNDSDSGATFASSNIVEPSTGVAVSSMLNINVLTADTANLNFDFTMFGNNYSGGGAMGSSGNVLINYHADNDSILDYAWNFDYLGTNPFGMQNINIYLNGSYLAVLGNVGIIGHHEGIDTFNLLSGNDYMVQMQFQPNVSGGGIGNIDGQLTGDISFDFNGVSVPEPSTMLLLGSGLISLATLRKKLIKK